MSLMGTLAKVAIGYAAARGVDSLSRSRGGMPGQFGGAQVPADEARAEQAPGMGSLQDMIGQMASGAGMGDLQNMIANMAKQSGFDLSAIMGGGAAQPGGKEDKGGLLSAQPGAGGGLAGHNGLRSVEAHLHTRDFTRVRIGVGKPPGGKEQGAGHVLSKTNGATKELLAAAVVEAADAVELILTEGVDAAMARVNAK